MPENKHRNPFEDHINSESFDVSYLGSVQERSDFEQKMEAFLDDLPDTFDTSLYDSALDPRQQAICSYLTSRLCNGVLRDEYGDIFEDVSDKHLQRMLIVPVAIALLAGQRLQEPPQPEPVAVVDDPHPSPVYRDDFAELPPNFGDVLTEWAVKARDFIISLFRRS